MNYVPAETLFDEITDFLISQPTIETIIEFQVSDKLNRRLHELLDKNSAGTIIADERSELDTFLHYGHILSILKAKARLKLLEDDV
jgi:HKD family nuclease